MKEHYKYPSIEQFRTIVKEVTQHYNHKEQPFPTLTFTGTVKLHGTNASVVLPDNYPQSRNEVLGEGKDNAGFAAWHSTKTALFNLWWEWLKEDHPEIETAVIYGEWAGQGVQKGVGISELPKDFYAFGIKVIDAEGNSKWLKDFLSPPDVKRIEWAGVFTCDINFSNPQLVQNHLISLTEKVEEQCPMASIYGISGVGEGIVWKHITDDGHLIAFKVKGEKHIVSKVKTLASVDVDRLCSIQEFVDYAVTDNRLLQIKSEMEGALSSKDTGDFIKRVSADVHKEESDTLLASGLTMKDVGSALSKKARDWLLMNI